MPTVAKFFPKIFIFELGEFFPNAFIVELPCPIADQNTRPFSTGSPPH
jgi:hypothetical protein